MAPKRNTKNVNDKKDCGPTGSSTDEVFNPSLTALTEEQLEYLSLAFSGLSLQDQRTVAEKCKTAINVLQTQKKALGFSVKQLNVKLNNQAKKEATETKDKPPSPRKSTDEMVLSIVIDAVTSNVSVKPSERFGTLRQYIVRQWDMKKDQKVSFDKLNGQPFPLHPKTKAPSNSSSYIYTFNVQNGDGIDASRGFVTARLVLMPMMKLFPIGQNTLNHDADDATFVEQTIAEMGLEDGDESGAESGGESCGGVNDQDVQ